MGRIAYLRRIFASYLFTSSNQLTFWHETPAVNEAAFAEGSDQFYMAFAGKADYPGPFDQAGVPMLDYHGDIGRQYNPIAIAQYGLANWNRYRSGGDAESRRRFFLVADWLVDNLEPNAHGVPVWMHHFDFEYFRTLKAPWYSGLAQGQGLAVLARAWTETGDARFAKAAEQAFIPLTLDVAEGGVLFTDEASDIWVEEYIVEPPTHIVNGFIWALWGVLDHAEAFDSAPARELFEAGARTVARNLERYDSGFWSYYELTPQAVKSIASPYYHRLHLVQLDVMHRLTGIQAFRTILERWRGYAATPWRRALAKLYKIAFKLVYY